MITRTTDPELINRIANSEGVRPFMRPDAAVMDFGVAVADPCTRTGVVFLTNGDDALAVFEITADREWTVDTMFALSCRGKRAIQTAREMIDWMRPYADRIWGVTAKDNRKASWFNRFLGAKSFGCCDTHDFFEMRLA